MFAKPPVQSDGDRIKPASPEPKDELAGLKLQPPSLKTPGSSPAKPEGVMVSCAGKLNFFLILKYFST